MGSKLGTHNNTITDRDKLRDFVLTARPKVIKTLHHDAGFWGEIKAEYPELVLIGRKYFERQRYDNPISDAEKAVGKILDTSTVRICDAWEIYNEALGGHGWDEPTKDYLQLDAHAGLLLHREGLKQVAGSWSVGCPSDLGVWTWRHMLAVVNQADYIGLHEYLAWLMWHLKGFDPQYHDREQYLTTGWFTLRYRMVRGILEEMLAQGQIDRIPDFIISECGVDGGAWHWGDPSHQGGWREANLTPAQYMEQLAWYDRQLQRDDYVVGAMVYCGQVLDMENWASFRLGDEMMPLLQAHIMASREDVPEPEPKPDDEPVSPEIKLAISVAATKLLVSRASLGVVMASMSEIVEKLEDVMEALAPDPTPLIPFWAAITAAATATGMDPLILAGLIQAESKFVEGAEGKHGERGLVQIMPDAWSDVMDEPYSRAWEPDLNILGGASYWTRQWGWISGRYGKTDIMWAFAAYNGGPGNCTAWLEAGLMLEELPGWIQPRLENYRVGIAWARAQGD